MILDYAAFCCSFSNLDSQQVSKLGENVGAFHKTLSQTVPVEESAFDYFDVDEEAKSDGQTKAEDVQNTRAEMLAERELITNKFNALNIDTTAVKYFYKLLRNVSVTEDNFMQSIALMVEMIINEYEKGEDEPVR